MVEPRNVNVAEAMQLVAGGALLLDVREDNEWEAGHAPDAVHMALNEVPDHVASFQSDRLVVCVCRSGGRSGRATKFLTDHGIGAVNLEGGMLAWESDGEALVGDGDQPNVI